MVSKKNLPRHLPFCLMARGGHNNCAILFQWSDRSSAIIYSFYSKYFFLLVPQFLFNLQSISTLTLAYYCSVNFFSKSCVIQDHSQGKIIGMGQMHANLYILEFNLPSVFSEFYNPSATCNNVTLPQNEIWHYHLGHPSHVKLHTLWNELNISPSSVNPTHCLICRLAKQHKLPFISSNSLSDYHVS